MQTTQQTDKDQCASVHCDLAYRQRRVCTDLATDYFVPYRQKRVCTWQQITLYPTERQRRVGTWQQITLYLQRRGCTWQQITLYLQTDKDGCVPGNRLLCTLQRDKDGCVPGNRLLCTYRQTKTGVYPATDYFVPTDRQKRVCTWQASTPPSHLPAHIMLWVSQSW